jgi:manganese/iron transport system permease protein
MSWLTDPFQEEVFRRALVEVVISGAVCGALGAHVVLRRLSFMSDALSHAVLPGVVIAYLLVGAAGVLYGAFVAGAVAAVAIGLITRDPRVRADAAIGIVLAGGFALGVVLISTQRTFASALEDFLFGNVLLVSPEDLIITLVLTSSVVVVLVTFHRRFVFRAFDPDTTEALGLNATLIDLVLLVTLACTVVVALRSLGNILVVALLITPAATARLFVDRVIPMMFLSAGIGAVSAVLGWIVAFHLNVATGALIVCITTATFLVALVFNPGGPVMSRLRGRQLVPAEPPAHSH